jgi:hemoglobin
MRVFRAGRNISEAQFKALMEDLVKSPDKFNVPGREKGELPGARVEMKNDIING